MGRGGPHAGWLLQRDLLTHVGQTPGPFEDSQGIFQFALNQERYNTQNLASNYQLQLSVRYSY